jgi:hypothetical protein
MKEERVKQMKSKEEILDAERNKPDEMQINLAVVTRKSALDAMDEYAKEMAIDFLKFAMEKHIRGDYNGIPYIDEAEDEADVFAKYLKP